MIVSELSALAIFAVVSSITPGPNNLMLLHGGLRSGFAACRWHILGISAGLVTMLFFAYWGIATIIMQMPAMMTGLKGLGTCYLLWLVWVMWREGVVPNEEKLTDASQLKQKKRWQLPLTFSQALLFQWINPKAWVMVIMMPSLAMIAGNHPYIDNAPLYLMIFVINLLCISLWAAGGNALRQLLHRQTLMQWVHYMIMAMTVYCAISIWW